MHVAVVHFPIGLLVLAGLIEGWRLVRRKEGVSPTSVVCVLLGSVGALASVAMGWMLAGDMSGSEGEYADLLAAHRWLGVATATVAAATAATLITRRRNPRAGSLAFSVGSVLCAALVGAAGHFGGSLTHGSGYLTELLTAPPSDAVVSSSDEVGESRPAPATAAVRTAASPAKVSFERDIQPILAAACHECHGEKKIRGGLRLDTPPAILKGGNGGAVILAHDSERSPLVRRILGLDGKKRMPVGHDPLPGEQVKVLRTWIDQGAPMGTALTAADTDKKYSPRLEPRRVTLPPATADAANPVDRILTTYYQNHNVRPAQPVDDRTYARRVHLDVIGLLPTPEDLAAFERGVHPDKRARLVDSLLADRRRYAEHWMSFWNDALRNDYAGPGYIDGGRKQITVWLYQALVDNLPYDRFVSELVNPTPASEGFAKGILWRGAVSASQIPELQAAQNISQVFMGINMKCASCHDSFISDWKLADAYGLAGVYADSPLEMFRCEKPTGEKAPVKFFYPQLGSIDAAAPKPERLKQLAQVLTGRQNGRFTRTIVNRLWARFMGRGLVEPLDEMDHDPWNEDLLDWLAADLADHRYDLKHTIRTILTSRAYQRPAVGMAEPTDHAFVFAGPVVKRLSAEQFCDAVSQVTGIWERQPAVQRPDEQPLAGRWIWSDGTAFQADPPGPIYLRTEFTLDSPPAAAVAVGNCDNSFTLYVNGNKALSGSDLTKPVVANIGKHLVQGRNVLAVEAVNGIPSDPTAVSPAALWLMVSIRTPSPDGRGTRLTEIGSDATWVVSTSKANGWENRDFDASSWRPAADLGPAASGPYDLAVNLANLRKPYTLRDEGVRAVWAQNDRLMLALGRPNREQVVTYRPTAATTLEALELTNGPGLFNTVQKGAARWLAEPANSDQDRIERIYLTALGRKPTASELQTSLQLVGSPASPEGLEDLLWAILMLPEFQLVY